MKKKIKVTQSRAQERLIGKFVVSKSGMGFVEILDEEIDVRVSPFDFNTAMHGDTVEVRVIKESPNTGRKEGAVAKILERNIKTLVGKIEHSGTFAFCIPNNKNIKTDFFIALGDLNGAKDGDKVMIGDFVFKENSKSPNAKVIELITGARINDIAMKEIILGGGFSLDFSAAALKELESIKEDFSAKALQNREDMRDILTLTIDPIDAKDFDDAISFELLKDGNYKIGVHIADVSHYVKEGSALDKDAYERATSVYLPDRVCPMLPEKISNELCSLRPNEDKMTFSAVFTINKNAEVQDYWLGRTVTHSNRRFTYEEAQAMIEGGDGDYKNEIMILHELAQKLRKQRMDTGAINFSSEEVRFDLDESGIPIGIKLKVSKEANQLIEELMLLANRTVATHMSKIEVKGKVIPFPYRIHDAPDLDKLGTFMKFANRFGHKFNLKDGKTIATSFNKMLAASIGKSEKPVLETLGIRCMSKAVYTTENIGHYGLAFENYCHFTSPIRRYPDVLVHRLLQEVLDNNIIAHSKLEEFCKHCSDKERAAMDCERESNKYKQVEYMQKFIGSQFEGVITGVAHFGFWVETVQHRCEGLISLQNLLVYDNFKHIQEDYTIVGEFTNKKFTIGDKVQILVAATNLDARQIDFELVVDDMEEISRKEKNKLKKENNPKPKKTKVSIGRKEKKANER
jgi:ribonuclease R